MPLRELEHLLRACRAAMPAAAGVVLATPSGALLAREPRVGEAAALAREAAARPGPATSALVPRAEGLYLVVFVPPPLAEEWSSSAAPALAAP